MILKRKIFSAICIIILGAPKQSQAPRAIIPIETLIQTAEEVWNTYRDYPLIATGNPDCPFRGLVNSGYIFHQLTAYHEHIPDQSEITVNALDHNTRKLGATAMFRVKVDYNNADGTPGPTYSRIPVEVTVTVEVFQDENVLLLIVLAKARILDFDPLSSRLLKQFIPKILEQTLEQKYGQAYYHKLVGLFSVGPTRNNTQPAVPGSGLPGNSSPTQPPVNPISPSATNTTK